MKITYDPISKALYIYVKSEIIDKTIVMNNRVNFVMTFRGEVVGIEITDVSPKILNNDLFSEVISRPSLA